MAPQTAAESPQDAAKAKPRVRNGKAVREAVAPAGGPQTPVWPADRVERRPIAALMPSVRNARIHAEAQIEQIAASIREFGFTMPVLVDERGEVIAGHGRLMAAVQIGIEAVPVMVARGWTEKQIRAYRLADNQIALNSSWDMSMLAAELGELAGLETLVGFSQDELLAIFKPPEEAPDEFPESDETIDTQHSCPRCGFRWSGSDRQVGGDE